MNEIVDRIKKLLRLGQSPNPHEAELALTRAFDLAARHKIDVSTLDLDDESERIAGKWFTAGLRLSLLKRRALGICVAFFNVDLVYRGASVMFIGSESDVAIAWYIYELIVREGKRRLDAYADGEKRERRRISLNKKNSFVQGFIYGIAQSLLRQKKQIELEDSRFAIVVATQGEQRQAFIKSEFGELKERKSPKLKKPTPGALMLGFIHGSRMKLDRPLPDSQRQQTLSIA